MAEVDPFPFVPVTCTVGMEACGSSSNAVSARMPSSDGSARRRGTFRSKSMCESSHSMASATRSKGGDAGTAPDQVRTRRGESAST